MSFYFAHQAAQDASQAISPNVKDRGFNFVRAKPCDCQASVVLMAAQPGYDCYIKNLPAFMAATVGQETVPIGNRGYPLSTVDCLLPWAMPPVLYTFSKAPTESEIEALKKHSTIVQGRSKTPSYVMTGPTVDKIRVVVKAGAEQKALHVIGTVNIDSLKMVYVIQKILSAFLLTHEYPAFRHVDDLHPTTIQTMVTSTKRRKLDNASYLACVTHMEDYVEDVDDETLPDSANTTPVRPTIKLRYAKPSTKVDSRWGPMSNMPNSSGVFIPFVKDLCAQDTVTIPHLFSTYFVRSLSSNLQGMAEQLNSLKSAWGVISTTDLGHEITHIGRCIDIALQCQSIVYPVYTDSVYEGTVISGAGYSIITSFGVVAPFAYAELQTVVRDRCAHALAMTSIIRITKTPTILDDVHSLRQLAKRLREIGLSLTQQQEIQKVAHTLNFTNRYWSTSIPNTKAALGYLIDPGLEVADDVPIHPKYMFTDNRVLWILSAFGHQAPTFMIPGGSKCPLDGEPPKNFHMRTTLSIEAAAADMSYVMENGFITNNMFNLSGKHKDTSLNGEDKKEVWKMLKTLRKEKQVESPMKESTITGGTTPRKDASDDLW